MFCRRILAAAGLAAAVASADAFAAPSMGLRPAKSAGVIPRTVAGRRPALRVRGGSGVQMSTEALSRPSSSTFPDSAPSTKRLTPATAGMRPQSPSWRSHMPWCLRPTRCARQTLWPANLLASTTRGLVQPKCWTRSTSSSLIATVSFGRAIRCVCVHGLHVLCSPVYAYVCASSLCGQVCCVGVSVFLCACVRVMVASTGDRRRACNPGEASRSRQENVLRHEQLDQVSRGLQVKV